MFGLRDSNVRYSLFRYIRNDKGGNEGCYYVLGKLLGKKDDLLIAILLFVLLLLLFRLFNAITCDFLSYSFANTKWMIPSEGIFSSFNVESLFYVMFLPLYIKLKSLPPIPTASRLLNDLTTYLSSPTRKLSRTLIFSPKPFSFRMYKFCFNYLLSVVIIYCYLSLFFTR